MMNGSATDIDIRERRVHEWQRETEKKHRFRLLRFEGYVLEAEDLHFHLESAVLMPDYEVDRYGNTKSHPDRITGLAVLRAAYLHARDNPSHEMLIVGHTDTSGPDSYNTPLSFRRAENVLHLLMGEGDSWVQTALMQHQVEDYQQILKWAARGWGWPCDPGDIDNRLGPITRHAVEMFQRMYNDEFNKEIATDGIVGRETWGAIFDFMTRDLTYLMETDEDGLASFRNHLRFVHDGAKAIGGGEKFPIDTRRHDDFRSAKNRRVEILFFEPDDRPRLTPTGNRNIIDEELFIVYDPHVYKWTPVPVEPVPILVWIDLQTVDELGRFVPDVELILEPEAGEELTIKTDERGYFARRVRAGGLIKVFLSDRTKVHFGIEDDDDRDTTEPSNGGQQAADDQPTATIEPRIAARVITDIVIPGAVSAEIVKEQKKVIKRYGRLAPNTRRTKRSKGPQKHDGEEAKQISSRGGEREEFSSRWAGKIVADNMFIAGLPDYEIGQPWPHLHTWLEDYHPTAISRGYLLHILLGKQFSLFEVPAHSSSITSAVSKGTFKLAEPHVIGGRTGAHATMEFFGATGEEKMRFVDMNTNLTGYVLVNEPDREFTLLEVVEEGQKEPYREILKKHLALRQIELVYLYAGDILWASRKGGTGILEAYSEKKDLRERIHERNLAVARGIKISYEFYLRGYIDKVKNIPSDAQKVSPSDPHPEIQLWRLGPPDASFKFPKPAGASDDEYDEIIDAGGASALDAWKEISKKLDEIWDKRSEGSVWFVVEFTAEAGEFVGPFSGSNVKLNFEVDDEFRVKKGAQRTLAVSLKGGDDTVKGALTVEKDMATGREKTKANFNLGKYGVEADSDGNVKFSAGVASTEWNQASAQGGIGLDVSLKDMVTQNYRAGEVPEWVTKLPDLKAKVGIGFRLVTEGTILRLVSNAPGFFEMRPRAEFTTLDWASLKWDEQGFLEELGWDREKWDARKLPRPCKEKKFVELEPRQKVAATRLPIPTSDPEWLNFWLAFGK
jgi:hypothetical protein